jgi:isoquinoline 1-oxidoreductase beta subunit
MRRRTLFLAGAGAAGALVVGWGVLPPRARLGDASTLVLPTENGVPAGVGLNGWIAVAADGAVLLAMPRSEMGQGVHTALAMLAAEELDVPLDRVRLVDAGHDALHGNVHTLVHSVPFFHPSESEPETGTWAARSGQWVVAKVARELGIRVTGGSASVADAWEPLRLAAATARAQLVGAASLAWKLPIAELTVEDGIVSHPSGPRAHWGELAASAARTPPGRVEPKARERWRLIGTPAARIDVRAKADGSALFGADVRLPDLLFAAVRHPPARGGSVGALDVAPALALAGVLRVVRLGSHAGSTPALAVVGRTSWHARRGADALAVQWLPRPGPPVSSARVAATLDAAAADAALHGGGFAFHSRGDAAGAFHDAPPARVVERRYRSPHLAHQTMEPQNCTARVGGDGTVELWLPTQAPGLARRIAAEVAGVDESAVTVHVTYLGGGFGRRLEVDLVGQAVRVALETGGRPVQLQWSREDDTRHDFYRPAAAGVLRAAVDAAGLPIAFSATTAGDAIVPRWIERAVPRLAGPFDTPDKTASEGLFDQPYAIRHQRIAHVATRSGVPIGYWRSVGHSHNAFFHERFVDELAHAAGRDPVAFRLALLEDAPRHRAVLRLAAQKAGWPGQGSDAPLAAGRARGVALHESFGSVVAQVVEVSLEAGGRPRVHRVVCAADIGTVVNPAIVAQQMEGAVVFALSAALHGRIDIEDGAVRQSTFADLPIVAMAAAPVVETHLVASTRPPAGVGEIGVPPLAPALANALFVLTGQQLRELPLRVDA